MGPESAQLKAHIDETRDELGRNIQQLEAKVKHAFDWRAQFGEHPMTMIGLAFGAGVLLAAATSGRSRSSDWDGEDVATPTYVSNSKYRRGRRPGPSAQRTADTWDRMKGALVGVAASKAQSFLEDMLPGFRKEYEKSASERDWERREERPPQATRTA